MQPLLPIGANTNAKDDSGIIAIHRAAFGGSAPAWASKLTPETGEMIHHAARLGVIECNRLLLESGADLGAKSAHGAKPIDITQQPDQLEFVCVIFEVTAVSPDSGSPA